MIRQGSRLAIGVAATLLVAALAASQRSAGEKLTLARAIPNDVFLYAAERSNPEREFLNEYWGEVFEALKECGIGQDLLELIGSFLGEDGPAKVERLKERASELLAGVDWENLASREMVFAERLDKPVRLGGGVHMPPQMAWLFLGDGDDAEQNYEGLVAILEAVSEEVNNAVQAEVLVVERSTRMGAELASVNLLGMVPGAPPMTLAVGLRDDLVLITFGDQMLKDVLSLLDGSSTKKALADDPRFKAALAKLPPAEDGLSFFDVQALLESLRGLIDMATGVVGLPCDVYVNTHLNPEASELTGQAFTAYQRGDIERALALTEKAHKAAPKDCIPLYNLACFHALLGHKEEALTWLEKAVDGGFFAPAKITGDPDLDSLRDEPRYAAALEMAIQKAAEHSAKDIVTNSSKKGEAHKLYMQAWEVCKQDDYDQALKLMEQAHAVAPKDSRPLYGLACVHALLGHQHEALTWLEKAVDGGFYCPCHMSTDPDLESIRGHERYEAALAKARKKAAELGAGKRSGKARVVQRIADRVLDAVGVIDYVAAVESTEGYSVRTESVAVLVPDASERAIYTVFARRSQLTDFDRYLPQETMSFSVDSGFDADELYKFILDTVRAVGPPGEEVLGNWDALQEEIGLNVEKDLISWIDGGWVSVTLENDIGSVWLIKVTDEQLAREKVEGALELLSTGVTELATQNPAMAMLAALVPYASPLVHEELKGFNSLQLAVSPEPIVWGVADGHLIFGTSADAVALCLKTAEGEHPNVRQNARVMAEALVPNGPFASVSLADQRRLGEELAEGIGMVSMASGVLGLVIPEPEAKLVVSKIAGMLGKLTPVVRKIDFYKSTATHTTFDGQTWYTRSVIHYASPTERAGNRSL